MNDRTRKMLEEFLQDLLFRAQSKEDLDLLVEALLELQGMDAPKRNAKISERNPNCEPASRCHLYRVRPEGLMWVGFVKGAEKTREMLLGLNSAEGGFYFLYDESSGKVVEFQGSRAN